MTTRGLIAGRRAAAIAARCSVMLGAAWAPPCARNKVAVLVGPAVCEMLINGQSRPLGAATPSVIAMSRPDMPPARRAKPAAAVPFLGLQPRRLLASAVLYVIASAVLYQRFNEGSTIEVVKSHLRSWTRKNCGLLAAQEYVIMSDRILKPWGAVPGAGADGRAWGAGSWSRRHCRHCCVCCVRPLWCSEQAPALPSPTLPVCCSACPGRHDCGGVRGRAVSKPPPPGAAAPRRQTGPAGVGLRGCSGGPRPHRRACAHERARQGGVGRCACGRGTAAACAGRETGASAWLPSAAWSPSASKQWRVDRLVVLLVCGS